jgi:hypothetical protein
MPLVPPTFSMTTPGLVRRIFLLAAAIVCCLSAVPRAKASVRRVLKSRDILSEPEPGWQFKWVGAKRVAQKKFPAKTRDNVYKLCSKYCSKKVSQKYLVGNVYVPSNGKSKWKCTCMTTKNDCSYRYMDAGVQNSDKWFGFKGNGVVIPEKDYEDAYRHEGCDVCWDGYKFSPCQD